MSGKSHNKNSYKNVLLTHYSLQLSSQTKKLPVNVIVNMNVIGQSPIMAEFCWYTSLLHLPACFYVYYKHFQFENSAKISVLILKILHRFGQVWYWNFHMQVIHISIFHIFLRFISCKFKSTATNTLPQIYLLCIMYTIGWVSSKIKGS